MPTQYRVGESRRPFSPIAEGFGRDDALLELAELHSVYTLNTAHSLLHASMSPVSPYAFFVN